jgi:hypothetical protein
VELALRDGGIEDGRPLFRLEYLGTSEGGPLAALARFSFTDLTTFRVSPKKHIAPTIPPTIGPTGTGVVTEKLKSGTLGL